MMKLIQAIACVALLFGCVNTGAQSQNNAIVLKYEEFGPQIIALELIGMEYWQWEHHGDPTPKNYDIKVVVYKNIDIEKVKASYPVTPDKKLDYRYVQYSDALSYLDKNIKENIMPLVTKTLKNTRAKIVNSLR